MTKQSWVVIFWDVIFYIPNSKAEGINKKGDTKHCAGFAKVLVAKETKENTQKLVNKGIKAGSMVNTDGGFSFRNRDHCIGAILNSK